MLPDDKVTMSVVIDREVKEIIEKAAKELDMSTSQFARNLIYTGLDDYKLLKKIGVVRGVIGFRALMNSFKKTKDSNSES